MRRDTHENKKLQIGLQQETQKKLQKRAMQQGDKAYKENKGITPPPET